LTNTSSDGPSSSASPDHRISGSQRAHQAGHYGQGGPRGVVAAASAILQGVTLRVHWNTTVLDPSALVRMFETARCDPLFMQ
jgi:hypothetical protein